MEADHCCLPARGAPLCPSDQQPQLPRTAEPCRTSRWASWFTSRAAACDSPWSEREHPLMKSRTAFSQQFLPARPHGRRGSPRRFAYFVNSGWPAIRRGWVLVRVPDAWQQTWQGALMVCEIAPRAPCPSRLETGPSRLTIPAALVRRVASVRQRNGFGASLTILGPQTLRT